MRTNYVREIGTWVEINSESSYKSSTDRGVLKRNLQNDLESCCNSFETLAKWPRSFWGILRNKPESKVSPSCVINNALSGVDI